MPRRAAALTKAACIFGVTVRTLYNYEGGNPEVAEAPQRAVWGSNLRVPFR